MSENNQLQSFYRPLTKEWSDVIDADFAKNTFATNPYEYRFANKPAVEKFLKDTFGEEFANSYVDKTDPIYIAASKGDLGPYKAYLGYLQDKGLVSRNTPSIGAELEDWVQRNNRLVSGPNRLYNLIDPLNKLNTDFLDVNYRASSPNDSESETVIKKILEDFKEFIITPYTKELVGDTTDYPTDGSDENACFISWDIVCDIFNYIVIPSTETGTANPISKITYTETGSPDSKNEHKETINSGKYKKKIHSLNS